MVWKKIPESKISEKDIQKTALYGLYFIIGLGALAWLIETLHILDNLMAVKDTDTLFYKLFGMTKKEWDREVLLHQKKLNKREREYMLTFKQHKGKK